MTRNTQLEHDYFEWICDVVCGDRFAKENSYRMLLSHLHDIEFTYLIPKDYNRARDGMDLRYRYGYVNHIPDAEDYIDGPCSVLEMMAALAIRCEETIMDNARLGDRTGQWFWTMVSTLGLGSMTDRNYDQYYVDEIVDRFLHREYEPDGRGGLFRIRTDQYDMRKLEIWLQLTRFLDERGD